MLCFLNRIVLHQRFCNCRPYMYFTVALATSNTKGQYAVVCFLGQILIVINWTEPMCICCQNTNLIALYLRKVKRGPPCAHNIVFSHVECFTDFAEPLALPSMMDPGPSTSDSTMVAAPLDNSPPEESIAILTSMGFPRLHSIQALKATVSLLPTVFVSASLPTYK